MMLVKDMQYFAVYLLESDDYVHYDEDINYILINKEYDTTDYQDASEVRCRSNGQLFDMEKKRLIELEAQAKELSNELNVVH